MNDININLAAGSSIRLPTSGKCCFGDIIITTSSGSSIRLPTSGKYCNKDIVITDTNGNITVTLVGDGGNSGGSTPTVKTFTITGVPYEEYHSTFEFEEGMTFGEWRNSPYNIDEYYEYDNGYGYTAAICQCFGDSSENALFDTNGNLITDNDVIIEGSGNYELVFFDDYGWEDDNGDDSGDDNGDDNGEYGILHITCVQDETYTQSFTPGKTLGEVLETDGDTLICPVCGSPMADGTPETVIDEHTWYYCTSY